MESLLLDALKGRFAQNQTRHPGLDWTVVQARLEGSEAALRSLAAMERTGGEPDVVTNGAAPGEIWFFDCAAESPTGRRSLCYDAAALASRKENKPVGSALGIAHEMGIELLTEGQYAALQSVGEFDLKTSSWLLTSDEIRERGGAIFGDRRFGRVFTYHNGAESYYASRGFRGCLRV